MYKYLSFIYIPIYICHLYIYFCNNDGVRNNYGIRLNVSCLRNHQQDINPLYRFSHCIDSF